MRTVLPRDYMNPLLLESSATSRLDPNTNFGGHSAEANAYRFFNGAFVLVLRAPPQPSLASSRLASRQGHPEATTWTLVRATIEIQRRLAYEFRQRRLVPPLPTLSRNSLVPLSMYRPSYGFDLYNFNVHASGFFIQHAVEA